MRSSGGEEAGGLEKRVGDGLGEDDGLEDDGGTADGGAEDGSRTADGGGIAGGRGLTDDADGTPRSARPTGSIDDSTPRSAGSDLGSTAEDGRAGMTPPLSRTAPASSAADAPGKKPRHPHLSHFHRTTRPPTALSRRTAAEQARFATRFAGQLLACGAALSMVLSALLGTNRPAFSAPWFTIYGVSALAMAFGAALIVRPQPAPPWVLVATPSVAAGLITVAMAFDRSSALSGMVLLTWPVLFAGYLLPRRAAWWTLGVVLICLGIVVLAGKGPNEASNYVELATSVTLTLVVIQRLRGQTDQLKEALAEQARTDDLTGLDNRRAFIEALDREYTRYRRYRRPLSLMAVDVDHFKLVNDTWGHAAGDTALRSLGLLLASKVRMSDVVGRIGGEEFAVLMPDCAAKQAVARAEALRAAVYEESLAWEHPVTVSIGVATIPHGATTPEHLQDAADLALYAAKSAGRNQVHAAPERVAD